jgi:dipeptidyl aminopeptidase/acylaminoacyl peptidase
MRSKKWCFLLIGACLLAQLPAAAARLERGNLVFDNVPPAPAGLTAALDNYLNARQATPLGWSPGGQLLIATRFGDADQLHMLDKAGGARRQVTFYKEPVNDAVFSPDANQAGFVFLKDVGGDENSQLYFQRAGETTARLLTDGKSLNGDPLWSNAGRSVAFYSNLRNGRDSDIYIVEPAAGTPPKLVYTGDAPGWTVLDWSPDDAKLLLKKYISITESYLYVLDIVSGQLRELDPAKAKVKVGIGSALFSRDGVGVFIASDRDAEFMQLQFVNLGSGERTALSAHIPWDVEDLAVSRDARYLAYTANQAGASRLTVLDLRSKQELAIPSLPPGLISNLHFDTQSRQLAFAYASPAQPRDAFVLDLSTNKVEPWTVSEAGPVDVKKFVTPRLTQFPTFDRNGGKFRQIPVYVYEPATPGPHPVLINIHGGPESQFRPGFDAWLQYVVNELGFVVLSPNVRGSSGYGKTYLSLDNGSLREDSVKDIGAMLVWISAQSTFDAKRVFVSGGSYGGYMSLATMVNFGDRLRGGIDVVGISNFVTFLTNTAAYRQDLRRAEYGDERDPEMRAFLRRVSPVTNAERITKPMLIVQGQNDPRVPMSESEQMLNRLRARGVEVWYLLAKDEGHGFKKKQNRDAYLQTFAQFLLQNK